MYNFWIIWWTGVVAAMLGPLVKQKKLMLGITFVTLFFMMSSAVPTNPLWTDLNNYEVSYYAQTIPLPIEPANDWAYYNLGFLCKNLGMTFMEFKAVLMLFVTFSLFRISIKYAGKGCFLMLLCFMLHMFMNYALILRNSVGFAVILFGFPGLFDQKIRHGRLKFCISVLIAAQFHAMCYLYLLLALPGMKIFSKESEARKNKEVYMFIIACISLWGIILIRSGLVVSAMANIIGEIISSDKFSLYAVARGRFAWICVLLLWILTVGSSYLILCRQKKESKGYHDLFQFFLVIAVCSIYIPLCIFSLHLARFLKYASTLWILYMSIYYSKSKTKKERKLIVATTIVVTIGWVLYDMFVYGGYSPKILEQLFLSGK